MDNVSPCWLKLSSCLSIIKLIWLILPVVICLFWRLSHACLSINRIQWNCEQLIKTLIKNSEVCYIWISMVILRLIQVASFRWWLLLLEFDNLSFAPLYDFTGLLIDVCDKPNLFVTYQLLLVWYRLTKALTGNGELGFDSGEGAWETATTSKGGSRRANYPIPTWGGSEQK